MESQIRLRIDYPDSDLHHRIQCFLGSRHFPAFRNLTVQVDNGHVRLAGEVGSFYEKQVALSSCQRVAGVLTLTDEIAVSPIANNAISVAADPPSPCLFDYAG